MQVFEGITLNDGEEVIGKINKSWLAALGGVIGFLVFLGAGIVIFATSGVFSAPSETDDFAGPPSTMGIAYGSLCVVVGVGILIGTLLSIAHVKLILTNKRVIGTRGVFARNNIDVPLSKIDAVSVKRSFLGSLLGYQSIQVFSPSIAAMSRKGKGSTFGYAKNADEFKNAVVQEIDKLERKEQSAS